MLAIGRIGEGPDAIPGSEQPFGDVAAGIAEGTCDDVQLAIISHRGPVLPPNGRVERRATRSLEQQPSSHAPARTRR